MAAERFGERAKGRFAGRLRELRAASGLTQQQLADATIRIAGEDGLTKDGIAQIEIGRRSPSWVTALALADALDVHVGEFTKDPKQSAKPRRGRPRQVPAPEYGTVKRKKRS